MRISVTLIFLLITASVVSVTHYLALELALYFHYPWLDIPMHIIGGAMLVLAWFSLRDLGIRLPSRYYEVVPVLLLVLIGGLGWELFEIWAGIPLIMGDFEKDIASDLCFDLVGGSIGYLVASRISQL